MSAPALYFSFKLVVDADPFGRRGGREAMGWKLDRRDKRNSIHMIRHDLDMMLTNPKLG